jgi:uncharacterized protein YaaW (UPF0174 family)
VRKEKAAVKQTLDLLVGPAGAVLDIVAAKRGSWTRLGR